MSTEHENVKSGTGSKIEIREKDIPEFDSEGFAHGKIVAVGMMQPKKDSRKKWGRKNGSRKKDSRRKDSRIMYEVEVQGMRGKMRASFVTSTEINPQPDLNGRLNAFTSLLLQLRQLSRDDLDKFRYNIDDIRTKVGSLEGMNLIFKYMDRYIKLNEFGEWVKLENMSIKELKRTPGVKVKKVIDVFTLRPAQEKA